MRKVLFMCILVAPFLGFLSDDAKAGTIEVKVLVKENHKIKIDHTVIHYQCPVWGEGRNNIRSGVNSAGTHQLTSISDPRIGITGDCYAEVETYCTSPHYPGTLGQRYLCMKASGTTGFYQKLYVEKVIDDYDGGVPYTVNPDIADRFGHYLP